MIMSHTWKFTDLQKQKSKYLERKTIFFFLSLLLDTFILEKAVE